VGELLATRGETLATAESCTGGRIASMVTAIPGSSAWYLGGAVVYANAEKTRQCGVGEDLLAREGAVSEPVARALAEGIRTRAGSSWGIGVTGIAGPGGATPGKPVGTVHVAVAGPAGTRHRLLQLPFDRERVQTMSAALALDQLRRLLDGTPD
jgi:nicotinamide-nucleotide amidase